MIRYEKIKIIKLKYFKDFRGTYVESFNLKKYKQKYNIIFKQDDFSSSKKNVLRGFHGDNKTWKLVQALVGDLYLVVLDVREASSTYGEWESFLLTERSRNQVLVPPGFANGHYALTDCVFHYNLLYKGEYVDSIDHGVVKWNDPEFQIEWPTDNPTLQKKDK